MSTVKIQIIDTGLITEVKVDNKFAYKTIVNGKEHKSQLDKLIELLALDNTETTSKEKV